MADERKPVDVLAELDARIAAIIRAADALAAARTAIAELIEADVEYDGAKAEQEDTAKFDEAGMYVPRAVFERMAAATTRRAAALVAVRGGAQ